jgi:hypothetical protein
VEFMIFPTMDYERDVVQLIEVKRFLIFSK